MIAYKEGGEYDGLSTVIRQPETEADVQKMYLAAHACPTRSIHPPADRWDADSDPYPKALDEEGVVLLCGHASKSGPSWGPWRWVSSSCAGTPPRRPTVPPRTSCADPTAPR
ncbi:ferredoxin [Streptomyces sp. NPDC021218]